jgi:hypothetical protein
MRSRAGGRVTMPRAEAGGVSGRSIYGLKRRHVELSLRAIGLEAGERAFFQGRPNTRSTPARMSARLDCGRVPTRSVSAARSRVTI